MIAGSTTATMARSNIGSGGGNVNGVATLSRKQSSSSGSSSSGGAGGFYTHVSASHVPPRTLNKGRVLIRCSSKRTPHIEQDLEVTFINNVFI